MLVLRYEIRRELEKLGRVEIGDSARIHPTNRQINQVVAATLDYPDSYRFGGLLFAETQKSRKVRADVRRSFLRATDPISCLPLFCRTVANFWRLSVR